MDPFLCYFCIFNLSSFVVFQLCCFLTYELLDCHPYQCHTKEQSFTRTWLSPVPGSEDDKTDQVPPPLLKTDKSFWSVGCTCITGDFVPRDVSRAVVSCDAMNGSLRTKSSLLKLARHVCKINLEIVITYEEFRMNYCRCFTLVTVSLRTHGNPM